MRTRLRLIVEGSRGFEITVSALIVVSLAAFSIETLPDLPPDVMSALWWVECVTVLLFTAEYVCRLAVAERPWRFARSFFGIVDLVAVLPFYLSLGADLRSARVFRLLRWVRIMKLARYNLALRRLRRASVLVREELVLFAGTTAVLIFLAAAGIYHFEHERQPNEFASVFDGLWWAVVTLTTVGYGDAYPITIGGRVFAAVVVLLGIGIVAVPTGLFASALARAREAEAPNRAQDDP